MSKPIRCTRSLRAIATNYEFSRGGWTDKDAMWLYTIGVDIYHEAV